MATDLEAFRDSPDYPAAAWEQARDIPVEILVLEWFAGTGAENEAHHRWRDEMEDGERQAWADRDNDGSRGL